MLCFASNSHLQVELLRLLAHEDENVRELAYGLVLRLLKHMPQRSEDILPTYLACLDSDE